MDRDTVEVHELAKKDRGQYPAILTEKAWSIKDLLFGFQGNLSHGTQQVVPSHLACLGSQSQSVVWFILPAQGASHVINVFPHCTYEIWNCAVLIS